MPKLLAPHIDRLTQCSHSIQATSSQTAERTESNKFGIAGPFTRAILTTGLGDLIRDVDASELGLFTLSVAAQQRTDAKISTEPDVARIQFTGATPLRKPPKQKTPAPEVYAQAAMKYIQQYYAIRPMPQHHQRVHYLLEQLEDVREKIQTLTEKLQKSQAVQDPPMKAMADKEEKRVRELESKLVMLKARKEAAIKEQERALASSSPVPETPRPAISQPALELTDESPFITPATNAKALRFTNSMLVDEDMELGNSSIASFASPIKGRASRSIFQMEDDEDQSTPEPPTSLAPRLERLTVQPSSYLPTSSSIKEKVQDTPIQARPSTPPRSNPASSRKPKINADTERIAAKIWSTLGDTLAPGTANKALSAKETIAHLRTLSNMTPPPGSPSLSSVTSGSTGTLDQPTQQQIMTAHLLFILLSSPNDHALSLNEVKDSLTAKQDEIGGPGLIGQTSTRVLYACVAKRLIKIDRGGGEQHVKFDI